MTTKQLAGPIYGVPWIEAEFGWGERPEGWSLFADLDNCCKTSRAASEEGHFSGGYIGPVRPLAYFEIPLDGLEDEYIEKLQKTGQCFTSNNWQPKYKSKGTLILNRG